ncbi:MAG: 2-keto-4-pentenoate hydratase [Flavobacteriales bacterium]
MITKEQALELAQSLETAEQTQVQAELLSGKITDMSFEDAYAIQDAWVKLKLAKGDQIIGHKIGLTSTVMQRAFGIDEPDFGVLFQHMVHEHGAKLSTDELIEPRIEAELAFKFHKDLPHSAKTIKEVLDCVEYIVPTLELIDFRVKMSNAAGKNRTVKDTISDNAANCAIIIGEARLPLDADLPWAAATLRKNGIMEASGVAGAVLDHPVNSILWLNDKYAHLGRQVKAGQLVLAGSFIAPIPVSKGDEIEVDYNQFGKIACSFI